jgi:hypothetical protein
LLFRRKGVAGLPSATSGVSGIGRSPSRLLAARPRPRLAADVSVATPTITEGFDMLIRREKAL